MPRLKASGYPQVCVVTAIAILSQSGMSGLHARPNKSILLGIVHTIHGFSQISRSSQKHIYHLIGVAFVRADLAWPVIQQVHDRDRRLRNTAVIVSSDFELLVRDLVQSYATRAIPREPQDR